MMKTETVISNSYCLHLGIDLGRTRITAPHEAHKDFVTADCKRVRPTCSGDRTWAVECTIHKINECVAVDDLEKLAEIYEGILQRLLS